jgi:hypothetical protein
MFNDGYIWNGVRGAPVRIEIPFFGITPPESLALKFSVQEAA